MRKPLVIALTAGLVATSLATPAIAGKKKKPKTAAPVATTLYLHGNEVVGEVENYALIASGTFMSMDKNEPTGSEPKSKFFTNYVLGPNTECAGNDFYPVWVGDLSGTVTGDVKVTFNSIASPGGAVDVRIWPDVASQLCTNETLGVFDYPEPAGETRVNLPAGPGVVEAVIEGVNFQAGSKLMLQLTPDPATPFVGRALYDSTSYVSKIEFNCIPASGASACTP